MTFQLHREIKVALLKLVTWTLSTPEIIGTYFQIQMDGVDVVERMEWPCISSHTTGAESSHSTLMPQKHSGSGVRDNGCSAQLVGQFG